MDEDFKTLAIDNRVRADEFKDIAEYYRQGNDAEKELAKSYWALVADHRHLSNYYGMLVTPLPNIDLKLNLSIAYRHLAKNHNELAIRHEQMAKVSGADAEWHKHLERVHREVAQGFKNYAEEIEGKIKEESK